MYEQDLALNNQQRLMSRKTLPVNQPFIIVLSQYMKPLNCVQMKLWLLAILETI